MGKVTTSWQSSAKWYGRITKDKGHYYHEHVVIPKTLDLLSLSQDSNLLDLGCGSGVLGRQVMRSVKYTGVDISEELIRVAKKEDKNTSHKYLNLDVTSLQTFYEAFSHVSMILSFQNMRSPQGAIKNAYKHLEENGILLLVLNHPMFRIPRQSSWEIDPRKKTQYRRIDKYLSKMEIPINTNPSDRNSPITLSFHYPLWLISKMLKVDGFVIELIEEWSSDKESIGRAAKMENRARDEFPLFMAIKARKVS